ncbi:Polysaccharide biosynthesis/export protein [Stieleria neptunia]|uniref:Polysaccharide biosynthesis/export protein n=1 Tax=Stieleria neptunia TaxID=2527979 RepID=A0A518HPG5_9BACT|nr:polysaccharide biosynthesis/export family protein [Stieleria neptunia]QDV42729.1 Polysaccharide biosynthesis/export protein [Stieleria neptunia]
MTTTQPKIPFVFQIALLPLLAGCSALGFSTYPVAHVMTDDTKAVLAQTPTNLDVPRELAKEVQVAHYLQPGDELLIETVDSDADFRLPADQRVLADGTIDLARFGRVVVASKTLEQAEAAIQRLISDTTHESTRVNVRLIQPIHRYYVIGEVNSPGAYALTGHETVLDAIMEAGGLTARASACDLLLARPTEPTSCRVTLPVCYRSITQLGDTTTNYHLKPGDRIFVSRQSLCEELTGSLLGGKTCDRCCKRQVACCDPRVAPTDLPNFTAPMVESIVPIDPPAAVTPGSETRGSETRGSGARGSGARGSEAPASLPQEAAEPPQRPADGPTPIPGRLDGELDFGMQLR